MNPDAPGGETAGSKRRGWVLSVILVLLTVALVAMLLTSGQMSDLRVALPPLSRAMSWLEGLPGPFDMDHVAFFMMLAITARLLLPQLRWWWLLVGFAVLAAGTELLQFLTVGRSPRLLDARDDMVGAGVGVLLGTVTLAYVRRWFRHCGKPQRGA